MNQIHIAYYRVSTSDQSIEVQRNELGKGVTFAKEFSDEGVSGAIPAAKRPGFAALLAHVRAGDVLHVYAVDRLGRDAIDVQLTVRALLDMDVEIQVRGLGRISKGVGELILAVLAQVADMERARIAERTKSGRELAEETLAKTGKTHRGKTSMGRPAVIDAVAVVAWRKENSASIAETAKQFEISTASVKRLCGLAANPDKPKSKRKPKQVTLK